jgi:acyl-CoA synthetase (AMP-forming)/AMP-acid ligase II
MNYASYAAIHARHLPDKVCLIERTPSQNLRRTLTWREFNDEINKVANYLSKELGIKDGDFVMHLQNNSLEWVITYYAAQGLFAGFGIFRGGSTDPKRSQNRGKICVRGG